MAPRKSSRRRSTNQHSKSHRGSTIRQRDSGRLSGELPFVREYADTAAKGMNKVAQYWDRNDNAAMLDDLTAQARRNVAATLTLGIAAGLFTTRLARRLTTIRRER